MPLPDFDTLAPVETKSALPDFDSLKPFASAPAPRFDTSKIKLDPYQQVLKDTGQGDPSGGMGTGLITSVAKDVQSGSKKAGQGLDVAGRVLAAAVAHVVKNPGKTLRGEVPGEDSDIAQAIRGEVPDYELERKTLPKSLQAAESGAYGLVKTAPQLAGVAAAEAAGVPAPISAGVLFGLTPEGFDPKQAAIGAALPFVGKYGGAITEAVAKKMGVSSQTATAAINKIGAASASAGVIGLDQIHSIMQLPPDQREKAWVDAWGNVAGMAGLGLMGGREEPKVKSELQGPLATGEILKTPKGSKPTPESIGPGHAELIIPEGMKNEAGIPTQGIPAPEIPEIHAAPDVIQKIKDNRIKSPNALLKVFPKLNLSLEQAQDILYQAWGKAPEIKPVKSAPVAPKAAEPKGETPPPSPAPGGEATSIEEAPITGKVTAENIDSLTPDQQETLKHGDGIEFGLTQSRSTVSSLQKKYDAAAEEMKQAAQKGDDAAMKAAFGRLNFFGGALMGASRGKHPISGSNYLRFIEQHPDLAPPPAKELAGENKEQAIKPAPSVSPQPPASESAPVEPSPPKTPAMSGPGSPSRAQGPDAAWQEGNGGDVYGIAQRVREARAKSGQVALPASGQGVSAEAAVDWGRELKRNGADPEKSMQTFEKTKATSFDLISLARAHGEDLAQSARKIEEKFGTDSTAYRTAQKALSDWDARSKAIQTEWHKQGMAQQGETDLDTGSFTGLSRAVREVTGEDLSPAQESRAKQIAKGVSDADKAVEPAKVSLQAAIDNLTETGKPRYSDAIIKIAEKIVSSLDKRADAARARIRARAFKFSANIDPTVLRDVAEIGASHIAHWGLDFAKWSKVMVDEFGDKINPHLKTIFAASQKLVDAEGDKHGANSENVKNAVKKTGGTKAPTDLAGQQKVFQDYETGQPMTPIQVKTLWQRAKSEYIDKGDTAKGDVIHKLAEDLGIPAKDVLNGLSQTKQVKRIADDVWQKQRQARMLKQAAKLWIEHSQDTWLQKALPATAKTLFSMKVGLHGTVALGTHAPLVAYTHPIVFAENFGKMYKLVASPEYFEMQKADMTRRPNYTIAQRNGLVNDMSKMEDFNDPQLAQGFPKMAAWFKAQLDKAHLGRFQGMGTRGYSVLKILRQDLFDHEWNKLPESQKSDSMAKAIADSVNHITGVTKAGAGQLGKAASYALFAPKLEASRVAVMVSDPLRTANSLVKMGNMTEAEKWFAKNQFKEKAKIFAVGTGLLLANQQLNNLFGDNKKLNGVPTFLGGGGWNPMASDFMKFRVAGMNFAWGSPFLTMARLPLRLYQIGAGTGGKTKYLIYPDESMYKTAGSYLRTQASPFLSPIISVITKGDYQDRPLPQIPGYGPPPPVPKRLAAQGVKPYTWPEFISDIMLPIPVEQAMNDIWHSHELSTKPEQDHALTKAFVTGIIMAGTGGRLTEDWNKPSTGTPSGSKQTAPGLVNAP